MSSWVVFSFLQFKKLSSHFVLHLGLRDQRELILEALIYAEQKKLFIIKQSLVL